MPKSWQSLQTGNLRLRRWGFPPGGSSMCWYRYIEVLAFQVTSPDTVSVEEVTASHLWSDCGDILTGNCAPTCLLFKVLLFLWFSSHVWHCFLIFETISHVFETVSPWSKDCRLLHRERKSGQVPRKVLVQRRRLPYKPKAASWPLPIKPDRLVMWRRRKFQRKRAKSRLKQEPQWIRRKLTKEERHTWRITTWGGCWSTVDAKDKMSDWFSAANIRLLSQNELC